MIGTFDRSLESSADGKRSILCFPDEILELIFNYMRSTQEVPSSFLRTKLGKHDQSECPTNFEKGFRDIDKRALLLVCRRFFRLVQPTVNNIIYFPTKIDADLAYTKTEEIKSYKYKHWVKGFRIGNPSWNRPLLEARCLSSLLLNFSSNLKVLRLEGTTIDSFLNPEFYNTTNKLNSLTFLELGSKFHVIDIDVLACAIERCPNLRSIFLTVRNFLPLSSVRTDKPLESGTGLPMPPIFNISIKFWDNSPARISVLPGFFSSISKTLKLVRLDGHLGQGLSQALRPVAKTLVGLGLTNILFRSERLFDLEMPALTTLEIGAQLGFLPHIQWHLFSKLCCLILHISPHILSSSITPLVNIYCLRHIVVMDCSNRSNKLQSAESQAQFLLQCMFRFHSTLGQSKPSLYCDLGSIREFVGDEGNDLKKWCDSNQISLDVVPRL
ncbi:expressed protein [Phakopsora pachyrhizi]|uniref:Expressed protein n=1 Tax=Phakopsora pachyrhizi TaxID=170000 RepID=A0AAV0AVB1_PHAPC|nr:expressed protein [Phakopsora pachyrhizi]